MDADAARNAALEAERALAAFNARLAEYQSACQRADWDHAEKLHPQVVACCETFLDNMAAGQRLFWEMAND